QEEDDRPAVQVAVETEQVRFREPARTVAHGGPRPYVHHGAVKRSAHARLGRIHPVLHGHLRCNGNICGGKTEPAADAVAAHHRPYYLVYHIRILLRNKGRKICRAPCALPCFSYCSATPSCLSLQLRYRRPG